METKFLTLWLEAPMQSWGVHSKFSSRDTLEFPSRSAVMGIILSALGRQGDQEEFLNDFRGMNLSVFSYRKEKSVKRQNLKDFHMVGNGYDTNNSWEKLLIPKTRDGKVAVGGGAKLTYRYFLQDTYFGVVLEIPILYANDIENALINPVFDIYLGRKNCVPTDFIYKGIDLSIDFARERLFKVSKEKNLFLEFSVLEENIDELGELIILNDVPLKFGVFKKYVDRNVWKYNSIKEEEIE